MAEPTIGTAPNGAPHDSHRISSEGNAARLRAQGTLTRRASLNALASTLDYGARVVVGLVINPLLVAGLGDVLYGVYQTLGRFVGFATPAGGRPTQALKWTIAHHQASTDYEAKRGQVGSALAVWLLFLPPLVIVGGIIAWFVPTWLPDVPDTLDATIRLAAALLVVDLIVTGLATIPWSILQGENLGYKRMGLSTLVVLVGGALTAAAVLLDGGLVAVAAATLATTVLGGLLFWAVARSYVAWFGVARPAWHAVRSFLQLSGWFLLWNLVVRLSRASDFIVLAVAGSVGLVATYSLARYVPEAIFGSVALAVSAIMPGLGGLVGARDLTRAATVRSESMCVTWLIATTFGAAYLLWGESFLDLWVGERHYPGDIDLLLIVVMMVQFAFIRNDASIIDVTLELRAKVFLGLMSAGLAIALAIAAVGVLDLGIRGVVLAFIAGRLILTVGYPWLACRFLAISPYGQLVGAVRPAVWSTALFAAAIVSASSVHTDSWLILVPLAAATVPVLGIASFYCGLSPRQRGSLRKRLARLRKRR